MQGDDYYNYRWNGQGLHDEFDRSRGYLRPATYDYHHGKDRDFERHSMFESLIENAESESESSTSSYDSEADRDINEFIKYHEEIEDKKKVQPVVSHGQDRLSYAIPDYEKEFPEYKDQITHEWYQIQVCSYFSILNSCLPQFFEN